MCAREEGKKAADCLRTALRDYDLKFGTILNDPDLASFRAMPEFKELQEEVSCSIMATFFFPFVSDFYNVVNIFQLAFFFLLNLAPFDHAT